MNRTPVVSSSITSIGWEPNPVASCGLMEVEFTRGAIYRYFGVPYEVYHSVVTGQLKGSIGHTFHVLVRSADYTYERIE